MADSFGRSIAVKYDENTIFTPLRKNAHLIILINSTAILKAADEVFLINKAVRVSPKKLIKKNINIPLDIVNISPVIKKFLIFQRNYLVLMIFLTHLFSLQNV